MDERHRIAEAIERTVTGPVWHGLPLNELLAAISVADAAARPVPTAHSIWELVLHLTSWAGIVESRLTLASLPEPTAREDFPAVPNPTPVAWRKARSRLAAAHAQLAAAVRTLDRATLDRRVPNRDYTVRTMLHGVVEHGAYHGGQVALMTKALQDRHSP